MRQDLWLENSSTKYIVKNESSTTRLQRLTMKWMKVVDLIPDG